MLLFLAEHEWHEISLLFYQFALRRKGVKTVYLGQSLPYDSLLLAIEKVNPCALVSSWLTAVDPQFLVNYFKQLHKETGGMPHFAGGYQINTNVSLLNGYVKEIKVLDDLDQLDQFIKIA